MAENNLWDWFFYVYYIGYTVTGLVLLLRWGIKSSDSKIKAQSQLLFLSFTITLFLASITDVMIKDIPQIAPIILLIPIVVIYQTITKYGFIISKPTEERSRFSSVILTVIIYVILTFLQIRLVKMPSTFELGILDGYTLRGIITQLQMLLSIYIVLKEDKPGFIAAILVNGINFLSSLAFIIGSKTMVPLPGIISYLSTLFIIVLIGMYKKKTAANIKEINEQRNSLKLSEQKLYHMAYYDSLTGLHNKEWFIEKLDHSIQEAKKSDTLLGLIFLDLDSFKSINDTMGHSTGDNVLKMTAERLSSCLREKDAIARFGADEFLILIANIKKLEELKKITDRIIRAFEECIHVQDIEYFMTASAGVAVYPVDGEDSETLLKNADIAMYEAKAGGKNQILYCSPAMKEETIKKIKLTNSLYRALDKNELYLHYQPQVEVKSQKIVGFEALLRWNNEEYGMVSPNIFIPMAEQTGLIRPIGLWVIKTACKQFKEFNKSGNKNITLSVNLSIEQLKDITIAERISQILYDTKMNPKNLQIEITESIAFNEDSHILERLEDIRNLGISVSIDDFGKGYSSFNRLKTFNIDLIKIDMDFVHGIISRSQKDRAIIKSIIQIAKNLKIKVLAEGVETEEQFTYLRDNGCDIIQGYYFYKPMPASEIEKLNILEAYN
jgi:diguanylate cyclase (GGDEF)-like protein